jgi:hypothetical protein
MNKLCLKCNINKSVDDFHKNKTNKGGYHKYCKSCRSTRKIMVQPEPGKKFCTACKKEKEICYFSKNSSSVSGLASWCKLCTNARAHAKRVPVIEAKLKRKAEFKATTTHKKCTKCHIIQPLSEYRKAGGTTIRSDCKTCCDKINKPYRREYLLKKLYGISMEEYNNMVSIQNNLCAICGSPEPHEGASLAVDHSHSTGKIRELLCSHCNLLLGHAKDSIETLENAIKYLLQHN